MRSQMSATPDSTLADLQRSNADLQRKLAEAEAERDEALQRETATAEVLGVINSSPGDLAPVFDALVERAVRLCEADEALVRTFDGDVLHLAAAHGEPDAIARVRALGPSQLNGLYELLGRGERIIHIVDVRQHEV